MTTTYGKDAHRVAQLTDEQYKVTQQGATEAPFDNDFWDPRRPGIYVDVVSGEPLFASTTKFDSGCGWPSFSTPIDPDNVAETPDLSRGMTRIEVRRRTATAISATSSTTVRPTPVDSGTASTRPPCGSSPRRTSSARATAGSARSSSPTSPTSPKREDHDDRDE